MGMTIQNFVDSVATKANVDASTAETAVGTILSAIQQEGNSTKVGELFNQIPGAADLAQKHAVVIGGGGMLGARDLARRRVRAASSLEWAGATVARAGQIAQGVV